MMWLLGCASNLLKVTHSPVHKKKRRPANDDIYIRLSPSKFQDEVANATLVILRLLPANDDLVNEPDASENTEHKV